MPYEKKNKKFNNCIKTSTTSQLAKKKKKKLLAAIKSDEDLFSFEEGVV